MDTSDLRNPNDRLYVICALVATAVMMVSSVASLVYFAVYAPSEWHTLDETVDSTGSAYFVICTAVFIYCLYLLVKDLKGRLERHPGEDAYDVVFNSPMGKGGILFAVTVTTTLALILMSHLIGEEISEDFLDDMANYDMMASMMCAGPSEELIFRALLIGLPVYLVCCYKHRASPKDILGGFGMSRTALIFLIISSVLFGLAHLDGWSIMKFPDTFVSGMLFGYVFIRYGIHVTIVMHSSFDLMASFDIFYDGLGTCPLLALTVIGAILLIRSLIDYRRYLPENDLHEPFDGSLVEMWERD